jgi:hypothetical protein
MMRQAGRYLPQYRAVRATSDFLSMCRTPELAVEVTLQPLDLVGVDAAIIFSDILVIPEAMGMHLTLDEGVGPQFPSPLRSLKDLDQLHAVDPHEHLKYVLDALAMARREINGKVPLIGFAGSPWTLAAYMVEGKGTKQFAVAKRMLYENPTMAHALLGKIADAVGDYLVAQVAAGAQRDRRQAGLRHSDLQHREVTVGKGAHQLGAVARPAHVFCVNLLPKTRSGKLLRRSIQAICEGRDPGDLTTIEDPSSLTQIREALASKA